MIEWKTERKKEKKREPAGYKTKKSAKRNTNLKMMA